MLDASTQAPAFFGSAPPQMKTISLLMCSVLTAYASFAPESIEGKVYRDAFAVTGGGAGGARESTIVFSEHNRYNYLSLANFNLVSEPGAGGRVILRQPPPDGTYQYRKISDTSAVITLTPDLGNSTTIELTFTGPMVGGTRVSPDRWQQSFYFTDVATLQTAPALNIAIRGRVENGRPLILGFVVPGAFADLSGFVYPPGTVQREVIIRVAGGASLQRFSIEDACPDPDFSIYRNGAQTSPLEFHYSDWNKVPSPFVGAFLTDPSAGAAAGLRKLFTWVGAFPLSEDSKDAVQFCRLQPGAYTVVASPQLGGAGGEVLIEVYFLP